MIDMIDMINKINMITTTHTSPRTLVLASLAGLSIAMLTGCDEGNSPTQAIRAASSQSQVGATKSINSEELAENLRAPAKAATAAAAQGSAGDKAAANILESGAAHAAGENAAQRAALADQDVRRNLSQIGSLISAWSSQNARADAAQGFDPASQIRELQRSIDDFATQITTRRATANELKTRVQDLESQMAGKRKQAEELGQQAGQLAQRASTMNARDGMSLVEQSNALRRQADGLRNEGELLELQAQELRPQLSEANALAEEAQKKSANFASLQQSLRDREAASRQEAARAREEAEKIRTALGSVLTQLGTARDAFGVQYDQAVKSFNAAASEASKAGQSAQQVSKLSGGNAKLALAGLQLMRMQQLDSLSASYGMLVNAQPALPDRTALQGSLDDFLAQAKVTREEAKATLEAAKTQFNGVQGPEKERFAELTARFENLTKAPAMSLGTNTPQALAQAAIAASKEGRWDDLRAMYAPASTDAGKELIEMGVRQSEVGKQVNDLVKDKFSKTFKEFLEAHKETKPLAAFMGMMSSGDLSAMDASAVKAQEKGDKGTMMIPGVPMPLQIVKVKGNWKFDGAQMDQMAPMMGPMKPIVDKILAAMESFGTKLQAGDYADEAAAAAGCAELLGPAMPQMPGMGGGDVEPGAD